MGKLSAKMKGVLTMLVEQPVGAWVTPGSISPRNQTLLHLVRMGLLERLKGGSVRLTEDGRDSMVWVLDVRGLPKRERFLLKWLSKEDYSALGECNGPSLDHLVKLGLAEIVGYPARRQVRLNGFAPHQMADRLDDLGEVVG